MEHQWNPVVLKACIAAGLEHMLPWNEPPYPPATAYDPEPLAALLDEQWAAWPALAATLRRCTSQWDLKGALIYLVDPADEAAHGPLKALVWVQCPQGGAYILEVLPDGRIGTVELREDDPEPTFAEPEASALPVPPRMHVVHHRSAE